MSIQTALHARGLRPRKRFGQHFLADTRLLERLADAAEVTRTDTVLEIGAGLGHLTRVLAQRAGAVVAVEIDADLAARLQNDFADAPNVRIAQGDVLARTPAEWLEPPSHRIAEAGPSPVPAALSFKVVANLPYYVTSAILRHLLENAPRPRVIVVMVQREVAQRIIAQPPRMNLLAVSVQSFARARLIRTVAAGAFYPRPKVDSAIVRLDVFDDAPADAAPFFAIVRAGFGERRKQLRNALAHGLGREAEQVVAALARAHIDPARRAETLTLAEWHALYRELRPAE